MSRPINDRSRLSFQSLTPELYKARSPLGGSYNIVKGGPFDWCVTHVDDNSVTPLGTCGSTVGAFARCWEHFNERR